MKYSKIKISLYKFLDSLIGEPFDMTLEPYSSEYTDMTDTSKTDKGLSTSHVVYDTTHMTSV